VLWLAYAVGPRAVRLPGNRRHAPRPTVDFNKLRAFAGIGAALRDSIVVFDGKNLKNPQTGWSLFLARWP